MDGVLRTGESRPTLLVYKALERPFAARTKGGYRMTHLAHVGAPPQPRRLLSRAPRSPRSESPRVSFPELVHAHFRWRRALDRKPDEFEALERDYRVALARFEEEHGRIVCSYWCTDEESAVAVTEARQPALLSRVRSPALSFHRVSDWATRNHPDIAGELHRCDEIAVKAAHVLTGLRRNICIQLVMACAGHLLGLADARARHESEDATRAALKVQRAEVARAEHYFRNAANRQAQMVYFGGMGLAAAALLLVGAVGRLDGQGARGGEELLEPGPPGRRHGQQVEQGGEERGGGLVARERLLHRVDVGGRVERCDRPLDL